MESHDRLIDGIARPQHSLATRAQVHAIGGTDKEIRVRLARGQWTLLHPGVYEIGAAQRTWKAAVAGAVLAAGDGAAASHRAAFVLWALDGLHGAPVEVTVPYTHGPVPSGVMVHRSRRPVEVSIVDGVPTTGIERTLVDAAAVLPPRVVELGIECALRRQLTTVPKLIAYLDHGCGRGVRGTGAVREILAVRAPGRATGSPAEALLVRALREAGAPDPVRQFDVRLRDGTVAVIDLAWPRLWKLVEVDGLDAHASADALDYDLDRQNKLLDVRWQLRRYSGRRVMRDPHAVAAAVMRFLRGSHPVL